MSIIVLFEGIDGSGKSTAILKLKEKIESEGKNAVIICGPANKDNVDKDIKKVYADLISPADVADISTINQILAYSIDRIEQLNLVKYYESLKTDYILIDRSFISAFAYQFSNLKSEYNLLNRMINFSLLDSFDIKLDYIFFIDTLPSSALRRINKRVRGSSVCKDNGDYERKEGPAGNEVTGLRHLESFLDKVRENYKIILKEIAAEYSVYFKKFSEIDGNKDKEDILNQIWGIISRQN